DNGIDWFFNFLYVDVDPRRLLDQAYAYGCLSAAWNADGEEEQRDLAIAAAIKQVRQTSY
ncbi:TPA: aminoglycoside phosphotransferase family protein, partial [Shigella flexneri]